MKEVNSVYNLTTDYITSQDFINQSEMDWDNIKNKVLCVLKKGEIATEDFIATKNYNPLKVNKEETDEYYLIDKETKASNTFRHQILSLIKVTREIYEQELSKLDDKPKTKIKR